MFNFLKSINEYNSTLGVQCNAKGICGMRFTQVCENCEHNCGMKKEASCFKPKKSK